MRRYRILTSKVGIGGLGLGQRALCVVVKSWLCKVNSERFYGSSCRQGILRGLEVFEYG